MNLLQESWDYSDTTHHRFIQTGLEVPTVATGGKRGTRCLQGSSDNAYAAYALTPSGASLYLGAAVQSYLASGEGPIFGIGSSTYASGIAFLTVQALADASIGLYCEGVLMALSPASTLNYPDEFGNDYQFIELGVTLDMAGYVEVRVNSDIILRLLSVRTIPSGLTLTPDRLWLYPRDERRFDDLYANDGAGDRNNSFAGPVRIDYYPPVEDVITPEFTRSTGSTNYGNVDETVPDEDATYNYTTTSGALDLFEFDPLRTRRVNVLALNLLLRARRALPGGSASLQGMMRLGGLTTPLQAVLLTSGYDYYGSTIETNPITASGITSDEFDEIKFGYRRPM